MAIDITAIELTADSAHHTLKEILHLAHTAEAMEPLRCMLEIDLHIAWAKDSLRETEIDAYDALLWLGLAYRDLIGDDGLIAHVKALPGFAA